MISTLILCFVLFFWLWLAVICFIKMFTLDSATIIPTSTFFTTPIVVSGMVILLLYLVFVFRVLIK